MPLRDHFRPPLTDECPWTSFHSNWAVKMVDRLNPTIRARGYRAFSEVKLGTQVGVDVAAFERNRAPGLFDPHGGNGATAGGVAVAAETYAPPTPALTGEASFAEADLFEVKVYRGGGAWSLVAAVELVSPSNKDREESRHTFAVKCAAYLQKGVSVVVIDAVTEYDANLHAALCDLLDLPPALEWTSPTGLSAVVYRSIGTGKKEEITARLDIWPNQLAIGQPLPTVPLWLGPGLAVPLELEPTYSAACQSLGVD